MKMGPKPISRPTTKTWTRRRSAGRAVHAFQPRKPRAGRLARMMSGQYRLPTIWFESAARTPPWSGSLTGQITSNTFDTIRTMATASEATVARRDARSDGPDAGSSGKCRANSHRNTGSNGSIGVRRRYWNSAVMTGPAGGAQQASSVPAKGEAVSTRMQPSQTARRSFVRAAMRARPGARTPEPAARTDTDCRGAASGSARHSPSPHQ